MVTAWTIDNQRDTRPNTTNDRNFPSELKHEFSPETSAVL